MSAVVAELPLHIAEHVFALRQTGRAAAAAMGADDADQVRFATALSELGREAVAGGAGGSAVFALVDQATLEVLIDRYPRARAGLGPGFAIEAARKLVDDVLLGDDGDPKTIRVTLRKTAAASHARLDAGALREILKRNVATGALEQMRLENRDLIQTLEELKSNQQQLVQLNDELEETNRGVMAMYAQLADELEETNRGVVALYAELDDKSVRLNDANEAKSRFLASVSHELRGPVNSILGLTRLLLEAPPAELGDDQRKEASLIVGSGNELLRLVNDLLDLAKAESGRLDPEIAPVDLADIFRELRGALRPMVRPGVKLLVDLPDIAPLETDRTLLARVLRNLLTNALKFTTHGWVRLSAVQHTPLNVTITVADTGVGIDPADQARVFEEFYQVRGPLQSEHKGTGLGLPYARRVTETLGGRLRLGSEGGAGSVFTVELPMAWQPLLSASHSPARSPDAVHVGTILIVDDDDAFRAALRGMLQESAVQVLEARGGREALEVMRRTPPDLAFVDLRMPDMDGAAVLTAMDAEERLQRIPVVLVTSAELTSGVRATLRSATALLAKTGVCRETVRAALGDALRPAAS